MTNNIWVWREDAVIMDRENILVSQLEDESEFWAADLWDPRSKIAPNARLVYKLQSGRLDRLSSYDYYPGTASLPVVSGKMKALLQEQSSTAELKFHQCEVRDETGNKIVAWAVVPLSCEFCIDRQLSDIDWFVPSLRPDEVLIQRARHVVWLKGCLLDSSIARIREYKGAIIVSDALKKRVWSMNPKGLSFAKDLRIPF